MISNQPSFFCFLVLTSALSLFTFSQQPAGWNAPKDVVEQLSQKQPEFIYHEEKVPVYILPELLTSQSGEKTASPGSWIKTRRPELLELFRTNVYGRVPATPYKQSYSVVSEDNNAMDGLAVFRNVAVTINSGEKSLTFHMFLFLPRDNAGPVPVFLLINHRASSDSDPYKSAGTEFWPVKEIVKRGFGTAMYLNAEVDPDKFDEFKNGIHGVLDKNRNEESWGTLGAWAWGASRCVDYFETVKEIDIKKIAVLGHSRSGKTSLWAGAQDERFSVVISNESGCGGAALARRKYGETVAKINTSFPHWFCLNYRKYGNNEDAMPVDQHMLLACVAPRALYVACADEDLWGDPKGSYLALCHSLPAFRLFDKEISLPETVPALNSPVSSGRTGFHIRNGGHGLNLYDWNNFMDFASLNWKK